jgi:hypothetical protein
MSETEKYRQQLRKLREAFYAKDSNALSIAEIMEFSIEESYLVKKMSGKF